MGERAQGGCRRCGGRGCLRNQAAQLSRGPPPLHVLVPWPRGPGEGLGQGGGQQVSVLGGQAALRQFAWQRGLALSQLRE